jgi:hypothetical protein
MLTKQALYLQSVFFALVILEMGRGSHELFAWAAHEL